MAEVVLENVSRIYPGGTLAVDSVSLEVRDKEFLVLLGPSGCGKSTTLRMIAGLEHVSSGQIRIGDRVVNDVPPRDRDIAMVFQNYALYPHMTVRGNLGFGLRLRYGGGLLASLARRVVRPRLEAELSVKRRGIDGQVRAAARTLGIEHLLERLPGQLSGGERQRVALGRAIVRQPAAFLFDEPLSNLDARLRVDMRRELKQLHQRLAATMIYVTHDQVEALTLGDRIAVMDRGALRQVGGPMEVYDRPANRFVAGFMGTPPMNFVEGELRGENRGVRFRSTALEFDLDGALGSAGKQWLGGKNERPVTLGVRPEDVSLAANGSPAVVEMVESLGDVSLVHLAMGGAAQHGDKVLIVSKVDSRMAVKAGEPVLVQLDNDRLHWFDGETGDNLLAMQGPSV